MLRNSLHEKSYPMYNKATYDPTSEVPLSHENYKNNVEDMT